MVQAARKVTAKDTNEELAHRRLTVLELAERLGNVTEACRRGGIGSRSSRRKSAPQEADPDDERHNLPIN